MTKLGRARFWEIVQIKPIVLRLVLIINALASVQIRLFIGNLIATGVEFQMGDTAPLQQAAKIIYLDSVTLMNAALVLPTMLGIPIGIDAKA